MGRKKGIIQRQLESQEAVKIHKKENEHFLPNSGLPRERMEQGISFFKWSKSCSGVIGKTEARDRRHEVQRPGSPGARGCWLFADSSPEVREGMVPSRGLGPGWIRILVFFTLWATGHSFTWQLSQQ